MKTPRAWLAAAAFVLAAVFASGRAPQEAAPPPPSQAPPSPFRLRVTEPPDGAIIPGRSVRIAVARSALARPSDTPPAPSDSPSEPAILVYLDGAQKATITAGQSSLTIDNVLPGRHKLTLVARERGEQDLDRKDVSFTTAAVGAAAAGAASSEQPAAPPPPNPAVSAASPSPQGSPQPVSSAAPSKLPATASPYPLVGLGGLVLLTLGAALLAARRRAQHWQ